MIICCVLALCISIGTSAFAHNTKAYIEAGKIVDEEIVYFYDWAESAHVVEFIDKENNVMKDTDIMVYENLLRAIYHSYVVLGTDQQPEFNLEGKDMITKYGQSSLLNDTVSYFYTTFGPENDLVNLNNKTKSQFMFDMYEENFGTKSSMFVYNLDISDVPVLTTQAAYSIIYYFENDSDDALGKTGLDNYNAFYDAYAYMLRNAQDIMIRSEPYYSTHYTRYFDSYSMQARISNISLIIAIFFGYLIGVFLPKLIFKDGRTIGRVIMKLGVINQYDDDTDETHISIGVVCLRSLFEIVGYMFVAFIMYMFAPFNGVYDAMMTPFIGEVNLMIVLIIITLISLVINAVALFTHYRQNLIDLIFRNLVVDLHYMDMGDPDDEYEGKSL